MLKDPLHQQETPYDLLGLHPNARPEEVHQALPNFMRRRENIPRLPLAMQAVQQLKDVRARMAADLMYYNLDGLRVAEAAEPSPLVLDDFLRVPHLSLEELYCDLSLENFEGDMEEIVFHDFSLKPEPSFGGPRGYRLNVQMDR
ncbi:MAG TPA: hypothetical protein DCY27_06030 [Desulfobacterales bacterium]|nr:hypothetical protein [Desulfobacterales bacterium]